MLKVFWRVKSCVNEFVYPANMVDVVVDGEGFIVAPDLVTEQCLSSCFVCLWLVVHVNPENLVLFKGWLRDLFVGCVMCDDDVF